MAGPTRPRKAASAPRKAHSTIAEPGARSTLKKLGIDESVVELWRDQAKHSVSQKMQSSIDEFDLQDAIEMAKKYASMSSEKLKEVSKKNPKSFYGGLAAILVGAGLLAAASRTQSDGTPKTARRTSRETDAID